MKQNENIQQELLRISKTVREISPVNPYTAPAAYFDSFPEYVISAIKQKSHTAFNAADEIHQLSPLLAGLKNHSVYSVEETYFTRKVEEFSKIPNSQPLILMKRKPGIYFRKLAAAASVMGMIGIASLIFYLIDINHSAVDPSGNRVTEEQIKDQLSNIDPQMITAYLEQYSLPADYNMMEELIDPAHLPNEMEYFNEEIIDDIWYKTQGKRMNL